ncbi:MAG: DMT family transporter [Methylocystaceae bacterium]
MSPLSRHVKSGLISLGIVYIIWSTTYLAIRITVAPGNGFPPFAMGATRLFAAFILLLIIARLNGQRLKLSGRELTVAAITGILLWLGGNGLVNWAEQSANSGFAALMVSSSPIWVTLINALLSRRYPSPLLIGSLLFGFGGVAVLMAPAILTGSQLKAAATVALLGSALLWSIGSVYQTRSNTNTPVLVLSAYQHLFGALGMLIVTLVLREPVPHPSGTAWLAWSYLVLFGSILGYTSFIRALKLLPINIAMTYSYVNPVLALLLGWWLLHENVSIFTLIGAIMVVIGVFGVFYTRKKPQEDKLEASVE